MESSVAKGTRTDQNFGLATQERTGELDQAGAAAEQRHEIQGAIMVAKQWPRNEALAAERLLQACERRSFAEDAVYRFPRGETTVEGPSVNLAREAGRLWGNIRYGLAVIRDDDDSRLIRGIAWDLESNTRIAADDDFLKLVQRKKKKGGQYVTEWVRPDERDLRELTNRRGAILVRNCILQLMPKDVIEEAVARCNATMRTTTAKDPTTLQRLLRAFAEISVTQKMIEELTHVPVAKLSAGEITELWTIQKSIADGAAEWGDYMKSQATEEETTAETKKSGMSDLQERLAEERTAAELTTKSHSTGDGKSHDAPPPAYYDHRQKIFDAATIEEAQTARKEAFTDTKLSKFDHEILDKALGARTKELKK